MNSHSPCSLKFKNIIQIAVLFISLLGLAQAAEVAGTVELVDGQVWIQGANDKIRAIKKDQFLYSGDIIITGKDGELQARMQDEAIIAVRANSKLKIESYIAKGDENDEAVFSLLIGTFRSVTGWIGKYNREKYAIKTTVATIGVRGTDHEPMYIPPPVPGMKPLGEPGLYDKVNSGRVVMINKFGQSEFGKNQAGFIPLGAQKAAVRLSGIPTFFKNSRHEKRINKTKKQLFKRMDKRLMKRQKKTILKRKKTNRALPKLLKTKVRSTGFTPDSKRTGDKKSNHIQKKRILKSKQPVNTKGLPIIKNRAPVQNFKRPIKPLRRINKTTTTTPLIKDRKPTVKATTEKTAVSTKQKDQKASPSNTNKTLTVAPRLLKAPVRETEKKGSEKIKTKPLNRLATPLPSTPLKTVKPAVITPLIKRESTTNKTISVKPVVSTVQQLRTISPAKVVKPLPVTPAPTPTITVKAPAQKTVKKETTRTTIRPLNQITPVYKTPTAPSPVPVPYPNIGRSTIIKR
jgi:hypothetical protein